MDGFVGGGEVISFPYIDEQFHCKQSNGPIYIHTATLTLNVKVTQLSFHSLQKIPLVLQVGA